MYKAIIVDDEEEVRSGIVNKIDWGRHGFVISGQAENGREALDLIEEDTPDVVITDITMPLMDGLQLAAAVKERFPTVKTAILTGFDDFKFAQQAIKYGVAEYLLKPVLPADIDALMAKLRQQLDSEIAQREDIDRLRRHYLESLPVIREQFLSSLVTGGVDREEAKRKASALGLRLEGAVFLAAAVRIDSGSLAGNPLGGEDGALAAFAVMNIAREILEKHNLGEAFFYGGDLAVVAGYELANKTVLVNRAMVVLEEIRLSVEKYLRITVTIGMGRILEGPEDLRESYRTALSALEYRVLIGENRVIYCEDIEPGRESRIMFDDERERQLASSIKFGGEKEASQAVGLLFGDLAAAKASFVDCQLFFLEMLAAVSRVARVFEYDLAGAIGPSNPYQEIIKFNSLSDARAWYERLCMGLARHVESRRQNSTQMLLERAKEYIVAHYSDNELSIQKLADHLHISASYLSMIFKKEAGETFLKNLVRVRLEAARELLDNTDLKSTEIAERIGYPDINYFSYFFKKNFGMSPREYRNRAKA